MSFLEIFCGVNHHPNCDCEGFELPGSTPLPPRSQTDYLIMVGGGRTTFWWETTLTHPQAEKVFQDLFSHPISSFCLTEFPKLELFNMLPGRAVECQPEEGFLILLDKEEPFKVTIGEEEKTYSKTVGFGAVWNCNNSVYLREGKKEKETQEEEKFQQLSKWWEEPAPRATCTDLYKHGMNLVDRVKFSYQKVSILGSEEEFGNTGYYVSVLERKEHERILLIRCLIPIGLSYNICAEAVKRKVAVYEVVRGGIKRVV